MATFLGLPTEVRVRIYDEVFEVPAAVKHWLSPQDQCESETEEIDESDAEPDQAKASTTKTLPEDVKGHLLDLLIHPCPDFALRYTCKFVFEESAEAYNAACERGPIRRRELYLVLKNEFSTFVATGRGINIRTMFSAWCMQALLNPEDLIDRGEDVNEEDLEEARKNPYTCKHTCSEPDPFRCFCAEHEACFGCGRWLAMAWFFESYPSAKTPGLIKRHGSLSHLGNVIEANTKITPYGENERQFEGLPERFVICESSDLSPAGEAWWRFELERQKIELQAKVLYSEVADAVSGHCELVPSDIDRAVVRRWVHEYEFLKKWNQWIIENERAAQVIQEVDELQGWLHVLDSERVPLASDPKEEAGDDCCIQ